MKEIVLLLHIRLKSFLRHPLFGFSYLLVMVILGICFWVFNASLGETRSFRIGLVNEQKDLNAEEDNREQVFNNLYQKNRLDIETYPDIEAAMTSLEEHKIDVFYQWEQKGNQEGQSSTFNMNVYYLKGQNQTYLINDIVADALLETMDFETTWTFYEEAINEFALNESKIQDYEEVRRSYMDKMTETSSGYFIEMINDLSNVDDESNDGNRILKTFVLILLMTWMAIVSLHVGLFIVEEKKEKLYQRIRMTGIKIFGMMISEYMLLWISEVVISAPLFLFQWLMDDEKGHLMIAFGLYSLAISGCIYIMVLLFVQPLSYLLIGHLLVLAMSLAGYISLFDEGVNSILICIADILPASLSIESYFDPTQIKRLIIYTFLYIMISLMIGLGLDYRKSRRSYESV